MPSTRPCLAVASSVNATSQSIGKNIVDGVNKGVDNNKATLTPKCRAMATDALNQAKAALGIHSPSKKFQEIGQYVVEGFALGLTGRSAKKVESAVDSLVGDMMGKFDDAMQSNLDDIQKHQDKIGDLRGQIQDNAENIAAAQADLNDAFAPIKKSTLKKLADRRAADAKANMERANRIRDAQKKLSDLVEKQNQYNQAINEEQAAINQDSDEYWKLNAARASLLLSSLTSRRSSTN
jgi:DNA repair ATPase RecN